MATDDWQEKRKDRRFPFTRKDAVYCVVLRAKSAGTTIALSTVDFSESGFQFAIIPNMKDDFFEGEKLFLKAIVGTRNLTFKEPIELSVRWQRHDKEVDVIRIGCEICTIASEAEKQFVDFIKAEVKFKGIRIQDPPVKQKTVAGIRPAVDPLMPATPSAMNVVSLFGGPGDGGRTATLLAWVENELKSRGQRVERIDLFAKTINGCRGCFQCQDNPREPGCVQTDDATPILNAMRDGDLILFTSPIYLTGFSLPVKALMDRCFSLFRGECGSPEHTSLIEGKRLALITSSTGSLTDDAAPALAAFHQLRRCLKLDVAGELLVGNCRDADRLGDEIRFQAKKFAQQLVTRERKAHAILIPGNGYGD